MDPIKKKLKEQKTEEFVKETIKQSITNKGSNLPVIVGQTGEKSTLQQLYDVAQPIQVYGDNPGLAQLEVAVKEINKGQKELEKIRRMNESGLYRTYIEICDGLTNLLGKKATKLDIYQLFQSQQQNVRTLNYVLASMAASYDNDLKITKQTLDVTVNRITSESIKKQKLDKMVPPEIQNYEAALVRLSEVEKNKEPEKYFGLLQEVIDSKRSSRKKRFEYNLTLIGQDHHNEQIDNLMLQEELFETMLYRTMELAFKTELYQQTLDSNMRVWQGIQNLSQAVSRVSQGIAVLSDFNKDLNESYIRAVRDIAAIVDNHPGRNLINSTNQDLKRLVVDVNTSAYRDNSQYDKK